MKCPFCKHDSSKVIDSRSVDGGTFIRRRRECPVCEKRFTTVEQAGIVVLKRDKTTEPFQKAKIVSGLRKACQGRPITAKDLEDLADGVEYKLRENGRAEIEARAIGLAILEPLRELDDVAYLRFASVYLDFKTIDDFENAIRELREKHEETMKRKEES